MLTNLEKTYFLSLFNRGGYVLDFSTSSFDAFTSDSIGEALCQKYGYSKGRSLDCYIRDSTVSERNKSKLLLDLLAYYKKTEEYYDEVVKADPSLKNTKAFMTLVLQPPNESPKKTHLRQLDCPRSLMN